MFNMFRKKEQESFGLKNTEKYTPAFLPKNVEDGHTDLSTFIVGDYSLLNDAFLAARYAECESKLSPLVQISDEFTLGDMGDSYVNAEWEFVKNKHEEEVAMHDLSGKNILKARAVRIQELQERIPKIKEKIIKRQQRIDALSDKHAKHAIRIGKIMIQLGLPITALAFVADFFVNTEFVQSILYSNANMLRILVVCLCLMSDGTMYALGSMVSKKSDTQTSLRRSKALELAKAAAERSCFSINVTGINANICDLGWGFFEQFDLVLSPVDSAAVRHYIDRGCKLYHIPHITCGTGTIGDQFTGNVVSFPADSVVDLEYVWGNGYRQTLEERRSCSDIPDETQAQVMGFSAQIAGMTMDLALKYLLGKCEDVKTAWKYILNSVGNGFVRDKVALRTFKYGKHPSEIKSELFDALAETEVIYCIEFDRTHPKHELWKKMNAVFQEDIPSYRLDLEWSLNIPVAYRSTDAYAKIEVPKGCSVDPVLWQLPKEHIYLVEGDEHDYLVKLCFTDSEG